MTTDYVWPGSLVATPALVALYRDQPGSLPQDCLDAIAQPPIWFSLWLGAAPPGLVMMPASLPYSMQACADLGTLPISALREAGFSAQLIATLEG